MDSANLRVPRQRSEKRCDFCKYFNLAGRVIWLLRVKAFAGSEKSPCLGVQYNNGSEKWATIANHHGERQWYRRWRWRTAVVAR
jgi:hypothetical protein